MNPTEKFLRRKFEHRGKAVGFHIDEVRLPNGHNVTREYLDHPGATAVIPVVSPGKILMVRQYRYPVKQITWEIPAGKLDKGEAAIKCVRRELEEETGYKAGRIQKLLSYWPTAAFANEIIHIYVATQLRPGRVNPDEDEFLSCRAWPLKKLYADIDAGRMKDSKTLIALLAYRARAGEFRV